MRVLGQKKTGCGAPNAPPPHSPACLGLRAKTGDPRDMPPILCYLEGGGVNHMIWTLF